MKNIFITPYNKPAQILAQKLKKNPENTILFIDSFKSDATKILHPKQLSSYTINSIIIASEQYYKEIYKILLQEGVDKTKISFYDSVHQKTFFYISLYSIFIFYKKLYNKIFTFMSRKKLLYYHNKHANQRCFIVGNGPSITIKDLELLKDEITFATNKIYLAFETTQWRPTYYFVEDQLVLSQNFKKIKELKKVVKFLPHISLYWVPYIKKANYYNLIYDFKKPHFGENPVSGFFWGASVTYSMIQMAVYMGFKEIYLLGIDFHFVDSTKKINIGDSGVFLSQGEQNHFHKEYRKENEQWTVPNMQFQEDAFKKAKEFCKNKNINIYNCSRKTKLTVFKQVDFDTIPRRDRALNKASE